MRLMALMTPTIQMSVMGSDRTPSSIESDREWKLLDAQAELPRQRRGRHLEDEA